MFATQEGRMVPLFFHAALFNSHPIELLLSQLVTEAVTIRPAAPAAIIPVMIGVIAEEMTDVKRDPETTVVMTDMREGRIVETVETVVVTVISLFYFFLFKYRFFLYLKPEVSKSNYSIDNVTTG